MNWSDAVGQYLDHLEKPLADEVVGRERDWCDEMVNSLDGLRRVLIQHQDATQRMFAGLDLTRLSRRMGELRQEHVELLEQAKAVRDEVQAASRAFQAEPTPATEITPVSGQLRMPPDFSALREHGQQVVRGLRRHLDAETNLVLEGVTTDIGAGD